VKQVHAYASLPSECLSGLDPCRVSICSVRMPILVDVVHNIIIVVAVHNAVIELVANKPKDNGGGCYQISLESHFDPNRLS